MTSSTFKSQQTCDNKVAFATQRSQPKPPEKPKTNDPLTSTPLPSLFFKMLLPITLGMVINGLYNLIDAYFIGVYVGSTGFAAVSSVFPIQMLGIAIAAMIANGTSILVSQVWGASELNRLALTLRATAILVVVAAVIFPAIILSNMEGILPTIGVTPLLLQHAKAYLLPITAGSFLLFSLFTCSDILRAIANLQGLLVVILIGALSNIALDYLVIVVLDMAVAGAAYATLLSQALGLGVALYLLTKNPGNLRNALTCNDNETNKQKETSRPPLQLSELITTTGKIISYGSPTLFTYIGAVLVIALVNSTLANTGGMNKETWISAYGIISRINIFLILPLIAITNTCQTLAAHNYGAKQHKRVQISLNIGISVGLGYLLLMMLLIFGLPESLMRLFSKDTRVIENGVHISSIIFLLLPMVAISSIGIGFLQAIGQARTALMISFIKIYLVLTPLLLLIPTQMKTMDIWYAFPLSEFLTVPVVIFVLVKHYKELRFLKEPDYFNEPGSFSCFNEEQLCFDSLCKENKHG